MKACFQAVPECFHFSIRSVGGNCLVPRPLPDVLSCSHGEPIFLKGGEIKSGSGLGTRLATNYAPYEEVMKTLGHCLETSLHIETHQYKRRKLRSVRLLCKMRGETESQEILVKLETGSYTAMYIYNLQFTQPRLQLIYQNLIWEQEHTRQA